MRLPPQRLPSSSGTAPSLLRNRPGARREPYKFIITKPYNPYPTYNPYKTYPTYNPYKTMINENNNSILGESNLDNREREDKATVQDNRDNSKQREPPYAERGRHGRLPRNSKERLPNASKQSLTPSERKKKRSERISEGMTFLQKGKIQNTLRRETPIQAPFPVPREDEKIHVRLMLQKRLLPYRQTPRRYSLLRQRDPPLQGIRGERSKTLRH